MYKSESSWALEAVEKDLLSTRNQSKIFVLSIEDEENASNPYNFLMNENEDMLSVNSLFAKEKICLPQQFSQPIFNIVKAGKQRKINFSSKISSQQNIEKEKLNSKTFLTFYPVVPVLTRIFTEGTFSEYEALNETQLKVVLIILRRKFGQKEPMIGNRSDFFGEVEYFQRNILRASSKRTEENNKFIFKRTIKLLKIISKKDPTKLRSLQEMLSREANDLCVASQFAPLNNKKSSSLSLTNLNNLLKDDALDEQFRGVLLQPSAEQSIFIKYHLSSLEQKLRRMIQHWEKLLGKFDDTEALIKKMSCYFLRNNQCKLPWTYHEVLSAVQCFTESLGWSNQPSI